MKKGLTSLSDDLEETIKGINDFKKSLNKALKDLKNVSIEPELKTVSTSSKKVVTSSTGQAKTAAASTLFNLLSGSPGAAPQAPPTATASVSPTVGSPPKSPGKGAPKRPAGGAPPKAPVTGGPPKRSNLPPAPKLPPTAGSGPPQAPNKGVVQTPSFAKRPAPPAAPATGMPARPAGTPSAPPAVAAPAAAPQAGGGLSSLRDEMLEELNRLKKIMRGD
jgi:DNA polymerase-3 subunit gamma/tau